MLKNPHDSFTPIDSDHISGARYNSIDRILTLRFKNGSHYEVHGVPPSAHQEFMGAESQGEYYHKYLKDNYHVVRVK